MLGCSLATAVAWTAPALSAPGVYAPAAGDAPRSAASDFVRRTDADVTVAQLERGTFVDARFGSSARANNHTRSRAGVDVQPALPLGLLAAALLLGAALLAPRPASGRHPRPRRAV